MNLQDYERESYFRYEEFAEIVKLEPFRFR
jgi:hypothetical protein